MMPCCSCSRVFRWGTLLCRGRRRRGGGGEREKGMVSGDGKLGEFANNFGC